VATTQALPRDFPVPARRLHRSARARAARMGSVYDQAADLTVAEAPRVASPNPVRVRRSVHDRASRWLALSSLVLVIVILALLIFF